MSGWGGPDPQPIRQRHARRAAHRAVRERLDGPEGRGGVPLRRGDRRPRRDRRARGRSRDPRRHRRHHDRSCQSSWCDALSGRVPVPVTWTRPRGACPRCGQGVRGPNDFVTGSRETPAVMPPGRAGRRCQTPGFRCGKREPLPAEARPRSRRSGGRSLMAGFKRGGSCWGNPGFPHAQVSPAQYPPMVRAQRALPVCMRFSASG